MVFSTCSKVTQFELGMSVGGDINILGSQRTRDGSREAIIQPVQRCFNWGLE